MIQCKMGLYYYDKTFCCFRNGGEMTGYLLPTLEGKKIGSD